jgi:hypothetical protein
VAYDDEGYGQAKGDFMITPRRTDALDTDPHDAFRDAGEGFVIRPETDAEIQKREQREQREQAPPQEQEQPSFADRMLGTLGKAVKSVLPEPKAGGIEKNNITGEIIQAVGILPVSELEERRHCLFDNYSDDGHGAKVLEIVPVEMYKKMVGVADWRWSRGWTTCFKELWLRVMEHDKGIVHEPRPPAPRPAPIVGHIWIGIENKIIQHPQLDSSLPMMVETRGRFSSILGIRTSGQRADIPISWPLDSRTSSRIRRELIST